MKRFAILLLLCGCSNHHEARWFSKDGKDCAMVRYSDSMGEWSVYNSVGTAVFIEEKDALAFARNACGGGDLKIASH